MVYSGFGRRFIQVLGTLKGVLRVFRGVGTIFSYTSTGEIFDLGSLLLVLPSRTFFALLLRLFCKMPFHG